jgi:dienelactone hydrolase
MKDMYSLRNTHREKESHAMEITSTEQAQRIVELLATGQFDQVEALAAEKIKPFLSVAMLQASWQSMEQQAGAFQRQGNVATVQMPQGLAQAVTCIFERVSLDVNIVLSDTGELVGLTITPVGAVEQQIHATYDPPLYAHPERFHEQELSIGHARWVLPGTLSVPEGEGPFPAVLLVHGSGPNDRDETIPPNKPFRDLAWGLASQGIAVLRYEKRTKAYAGDMGDTLDTLTVKEEVLDDALEAVALLRTRPEIDARLVFVLGHSLGGFLAPRLGAADPELRGLIFLAGSARPLEDLLLEQMAYITSLSTHDPALQQEQLAPLRKEVELIKDPARLATATASELPFNVPAAYWIDLNTYQPAQVVQTVQQPMLFLQGTSDYQVTQVDFQIWQQALHGRDDVQFILYPGLSHLFMPVEGGQKATPATYTVAGHVEEKVINDIADWIKQHD